MIADGTIHVEIAVGGSGGPVVSLASTRPLDLGRLFVGKAADVIVKQVPLLFGVCTAAQASAAATVCETAMGISDGDRKRAAARSLIVLAEHAREHILRILVDWRVDSRTPVAAPDMRPVSGMRQRMQTAAFGSINPYSIFSEPHLDVVEALSEADWLSGFIAEHILDESPDTWLTRCDATAIADWLAKARTAAATHIDGICTRNWQSVGDVPQHFLPELDSDHLWMTLIGEEGSEFVRRPHWDGVVFETGALPRCAAHPLVEALSNEFGAGLVARHAARLVELARIPDTLRTLAHGHGQADTIVRRSRHGEGGGLAVVETARGRLVHAVRLVAGRVVAYRILAPTEWNFHDQGVAVAALSTLAAGDPDEIKMQADEIIRAVDPCVGFEVRIH